MEYAAAVERGPAWRGIYSAFSGITWHECHEQISGQHESAPMKRTPCRVHVEIATLSAGGPIVLELEYCKAA